MESDHANILKSLICNACRVLLINFDNNTAAQCSNLGSVLKVLLCILFVEGTPVVFRYHWL